MLVSQLLILTISVLATGVLLGEEPGVEELADGIHRRIQEFRNVEFEYNVNATFWPAPVIEFDASGNPTSTKPGAGPPRIVKSKDVFRILHSNRPDSDRPWRFWKQSIDEDGHQVVSVFLSYDGQHTKIYFRRKPDSRVDFNTGAIIPFESTPYYEDNIFDRFLCTDLNGLAEYQDPDWKLSRGSSPFSIGVSENG